MPVYTPIKNFVEQLPDPEDDPFFHELAASLRQESDPVISCNHDEFLGDYIDPSKVDWDELERGSCQGLLDQDIFSLDAYIHDATAGIG